MFRKEYILTDDSDEPDTRPENGPLDTLGERLRAAGIPVTGAAPVDWRDVARGAAQKRSLAPPTRPGFTPPSKPARPEALWWREPVKRQTEINAELERIHARFVSAISPAAETFLKGNVSSLANRYRQGAHVRLYATLEDLVFRVPEARWGSHLAQLASLRLDIEDAW